MGALADDDVALLIPDLGEELGKTADWKDGTCVSQRTPESFFWSKLLFIPSLSRGSEGTSDSLT